MKLNSFVGQAAIINSILNRDNKQKYFQLGATKMRLDLADCIEFENCTSRKSSRAKFKVERFQYSTRIRRSNKRDRYT